jgi:hypothetical protein
VAVQNVLPIQSNSPAPGGSGASSAAGGSGGSSASPSLTLFSPALSSAPGVTRRLRLSRAAWRTSFTTLIPERPD